MPSRQLTPELERIYAAEKEFNFRWLLKVVGTQSPYVLSLKDLVDPELTQSISDIGQFAEMAHGLVDPNLVWKYLPQLLQPKFPLHGYTFLEGSELLRVFISQDLGKVQGYVAHRPEGRQLVLSFSGTSSTNQMLRDLKYWKKKYPMAQRSEKSSPNMAVHAGFWQMYMGVRQHAIDALNEGLQRWDVEELVFTAHSMGTALLYLLLLELLAPTQNVVRLPFGVRMKLVVYGAPRVGNAGLVDLWKERVQAYRQLHGDGAFQEWSVKAFDDGVPTLPPNLVGYRHFCATPFYLYHSRLYRVPESESEHSKFNVDTTGVPETQGAPDYPLGGHNYYGGRDMEKFQRTMRWAMDGGLGKTDAENRWAEAFLAKVKEDDEKWLAKQERRKSRSASSNLAPQEVSSPAKS